MASDEHTPETLNILTLPVELRLLIYELVIPHDSHFPSTLKKFGHNACSRTPLRTIPSYTPASKR